MIFTPQDALNRAQKIFKERYSGAEFCIAAGSIVQGRGRPRSDLDLIVVFSHRDFAFRESFTYDEMPVEVFVHDYETLQAFMDEDYGDAHASLMDMITTGVVLPVETDTSRRLQKYAANLLTKGPEPLTEEQERNLRYFISDLIDDLKGERSPAENRAILYKLYPQMGELALRRAGKFTSTGKHLAKHLQENCPHIFSMLEDAIISAHCDTFGTAHIQKLESILENLGGFLFDGYKREAPKDKRSKPIWLEN